MKKLLILLILVSAPLFADEAHRRAAVDAMARATRYFRTHVATNGGYLWRYKTDFSMREGEGAAAATSIWVQPPGTPAVGMAFLAAYEATRDTLFLNGAVDAAHALVWGQLASGGWDYRIEFDAEQSKRWHYRRDVERGDVQTGDRRNRTTLDDNTTQSALQLLMRVDEARDFKDEKIHKAVQFGLDALLKAQYPNGAWPQRFEAFPDPEKFPIKKARYPKTWPRTHPNTRYVGYYTFNDNAIADVIETMVEAHDIYGDTRYLDAAIRGGDFILLAQMPAPQPAWAQQYNLDMEPTWARRFEPPAITGGESFGIMQTLLDLYVQTGVQRFLDPIPHALDWAHRSRLPDGRMARFYELQTNRPLYFTRDYALAYSDSDMPTHYAFKVSGNRIERIEALYQRVTAEGREKLLAERERVSAPSVEQVKKIIATLDEQGRWVERGSLRNPQNRRERIEAEILSCRTFNRNLEMLARYVKTRADETNRRIGE